MQKIIRFNVAVNDDNINSEIKLSPNPAIDFIRIHIGDEHQLKFVEIFELNGRKVLVSKKN